MVDADVKKLLKSLEAALPHLATKQEVAEVRQEVNTLTQKVDAVTQRVAGVASQLGVLSEQVSAVLDGQRRILQHLDVAELKGRVEEQSRTIATLIPQHIAAVGRS